MSNPATPTTRRPRRTEQERKELLAAEIKAIEQRQLARTKTSLENLAKEAQTLATASSGKPYANLAAQASGLLGQAAGQIKIEQ